MSTDGVAVDALDGVLRFEFTRSERKNALDPAAIGETVGVLEAEANTLEMSSRTADFTEGLVAFRERRPADFQGR